MDEVFQEFSMWTLAVLALVLAPPEKPDDSAKDLAALNGKWLIVSAEFEGMDSTAIYRKKTLIVIEDGKLHFTDGFVNSQPTKFKLNVRTKPRSIDLEDGKGKKVQQGIYDLDKESLKLCFCLEGDRPKKFKTKPGDKTSFFVLQRQKP